jgi:hypothetical protein
LAQFISAVSVLAIAVGFATALDSAAPFAAGRKMAAAAAAFLGALDAEQHSKASFPFDDDSRYEFRFTPRARMGLPLKEMTAAQRACAEALLKTGLSVRGYTAAQGIIDLENVLRAMQAPESIGAIVRDPGLYFMSVYGTPGTSPWGWKFEGHHVSVNFTVVGDRPALFAPSFFGSNPAVVREGPKKGTRVLREEEEVARELLAAFDEARRVKVVFDVSAPAEMITAEARHASPVAPGGLAYGEMAPAQRRLLEKLLDVYLGRVADDLAAARLEQIRGAGIEKVTFGWAGSGEPGRPHYYRMQGPTFLVEYDNVQNEANHIHSVWRDFDGDFGRDLLREHYRTVQHHF